MWLSFPAGPGSTISTFSHNRSKAFSARSTVYWTKIAHDLPPTITALDQVLRPRTERYRLPVRDPNGDHNAYTATSSPVMDMFLSKQYRHGMNVACHFIFTKSQVKGILNLKSFTFLILPYRCLHIFATLASNVMDPNISPSVSLPIEPDYPYTYHIQCYVPMSVFFCFLCSTRGVSLALPPPPARYFTAVFVWCRPAAC